MATEGGFVPKYRLQRVILNTFFSSLGLANFGSTLSLFNTVSNVFRQNYEWCGNDYEYACDESVMMWSWVNSVPYLVATLSSYFAGSLLKYGRRTLILMMDACFVIGCLLVQCVPHTKTGSFAVLIVARIISGIGIGFSTVVVPLWVAETAPTQLRSICGFSQQVMIYIGTMCVNGLGLAITQPDPKNPAPPQGFELWWWRVIILFPLIPAGIQTLLAFTVFRYEPATVTIANMPREEVEKPVSESAMQLDALNSLKTIYVAEDAEKVLEDLKGARIINLNNEDLKAMPVDGASPSAPALNPNRYFSFGEVLANKAHLRVFLIGVLLSLIRQFSMINVFSTKSNTILEAAQIDISLVTLMTFFTTVVSIIGTVCGIPLSKTIRKRKAIIGATIGFFISFGVPGVTYWFLDADEKVTGILALCGMLAIDFIFALCYGPYMFIYIAEIHHPQAKNASVGAIHGCNWFLTWLVVFSTSYMSVAVIYNIGMAAAVVLGTVAYFTLLETEGLKGVSPYYPDLVVSAADATQSQKQILKERLSSPGRIPDDMDLDSASTGAPPALDSVPTPTTGQIVIESAPIADNDEHVATPPPAGFSPAPALTVAATQV